MEDKTGGPAFGHGAENGHCCGATLRDYFATHAMAAFINTPRPLKTGNDIQGEGDIAEAAYIQADAMLEARKK